MTSVYRPILKVAWQILWQAKYLWFFGFFAILAVGTRGEISLIIDNLFAVSESGLFLDQLRELYAQNLLGNVGANFVSLFSNLEFLTVVLFVILLALILLLIFLVIVGQAGLVGGVYKEYRKQPSDFVATFRTGRQNFWPVLGLNIINKLIIYGSLLVLGIPLIMLYLNQGNLASKNLFTLLFFIILIPIAVVVSMIIRYAILFVVIRKEKVGQAVRNGWNLFVRNWVVSIEMAIVLFFVLIGFVTLLFLIAIVLIIPFALVLYVFYLLGVGGVLLNSALFWLIVFGALIIWIGAMLTTFQTACWVLLFDKLTESRVFSKVSRLVAGWFSKDKKVEEVETP